MKRSDKTIKKLLENGWLAQCPEHVQDTVIAGGRLATFNSGEFAFHKDDDPGGIHGIVDGCFKFYVRTMAGDLRLTHVIRDGSWFGEGPFATGGPRRFAAKALGACTTFYLPLRALEDLTRKTADGATELSRLAFQNLELSAQVVSDFALARADHRIAAVLLRCTDVVPDPSSNQRNLSQLTQAEIGEMANSSRYVVNRTLRLMEAKGWIALGYQQIEVQAIESLQDFVRGTSE